MRNELKKPKEDFIGTDELRDRIKMKKKLAKRVRYRYNTPAPAATRCGWSGSSVWLERSPVTAEVASSSLVRFVTRARSPKW